MSTWTIQSTFATTAPTSNQGGKRGWVANQETIEK